MASHASVQFGEEAEKPLPAQVLKRESAKVRRCFRRKYSACGRRCVSSNRTIRYRIALGTDF